MWVEMKFYVDGLYLCDIESLNIMKKWDTSNN